jgi:group I intron endonuclease
MNKFVEKSRKGLMGIYKIVNSVTGEVYVGSSRSVANRIQKHMNDMTDRKHENKSLEELWHRHGAHTFSFSIVELVDDERYLLEKERYWIAQLGGKQAMLNKKDHSNLERTNISVPLETRDSLRALGKGSMDKAIRYLIDLEKRFRAQ